MKKNLSQNELIVSARKFCKQKHIYPELYGVTDGKAVGTFIEHRFLSNLQSEFAVQAGSSALGLDLPSLETDIKVTSLRQPQSSCPFRSARQKVFGLGYHLLLFVYEKTDAQKSKIAQLSFVSCALIEKERTADYQATRGILEILARATATIFLLFCRIGICPAMKLF